jgi:hypothetical protein
LVQYIDWANVSESSPEGTTAVLAEMLGKIRPGSDNVSTGIVSASLAQLRDLSRIILVQLKEVLSYQRQSYKLRLRLRLFPAARQTLAELYAVDPDRAYRKVKGLFAATMKGQPFYRDLVNELLQEEFSEDAPKLRQQSLANLKVAEEISGETRTSPDHKSILLEAVRLILPAGGHLRDALRKVVANQELLEKNRQGFAGKLRNWLKRRLQNRDASWMAEIRYFDAGTSATQVETIDFRRFVEGARRKASLLDALHQPDSTSFARLREASQQQVDGFLEKNIRELRLLHRRLQGLNEVLRREAPADQKEQLKGIKIELSGLKNCIVRSNRRRYEYVSLKEEQLRLDQLGLSKPPGPGQSYTV